MSKPIAPQAEPGDATVYVQLDEEGQPIEEIYVLQNETKKKSICGSICCVAVAAFLLCFFLIPRQPSVWLVHLNVGQASSGVAESAVTQITGTFKFRNENFFAVDWRAPAVSLYWLPYDDQPVVAGCWGEEPCSFWQDGWCAIKLGEFTDPGLKFSTGMRDGRQQVLELQQTAQQRACSVEVVVAAAAEGGQRMLSRGHVKAQAPVRKFGKVHVSDSYYLLE